MKEVTFKSVGEIKNPKPGDENAYYDGIIKGGQFNDLLKDLQDKSDFVIVTVKGKEFFTTPTNYLGGVCEL